VRTVTVRNEHLLTKKNNSHSVRIQDPSLVGRRVRALVAGSCSRPETVYNEVVRREFGAVTSYIFAGRR